MPEPNVNDPKLTQDEDVLTLDEGDETDAVENEPRTDGLSTEDFSVDSLGEIPDRLKPVLNKLAKQFKAEFTRKTQDLAETRRGLESIGYKAEVLDRLMSDPRVVNYLAGLQGEGPVEEEESETPPDQKKLIAQAVQPLYQEIQRLAVERERDEFVRSHPDWEQHLDEMNKAWAKQPGLTFEGAYLQAIGTKYIAAKKRSEKKAKLPQTEKPGPSGSAKTSRNINSFDDAVKAAFDELGIDKRRVFDE